MKKLTIKSLVKEAKQFCNQISGVYKPELFGVTDGKAIGTYVEHLFQDFYRRVMTRKRAIQQWDLIYPPYLQISKLRPSDNLNQVVRLRIVNRRYLDWGII